MNRNTIVGACTGAALTAALALAGPASAAYAPQLAVEITPAKPRSDVAITTTLTQKSDETASKTVVLHLPKSWAVAANELTNCTDAQAGATACPATSKMGTAEARNPLIGTLTGAVHLGSVLTGGKLRIWVFLSNGIISQRLPGTVGIAETGGGLASIFDNLPDVLTTFFRLKLDGPPRSLARTSFDCDDAIFDADFTSQKGEKATDQAKVSVGGCPDRPPVVALINLSADTVKSTKGATLTFDLDQAAAVVVTVVKKGSPKAFQTFNLAGKNGSNRVRAVGKGLKKGRYSLLIKATDTGGQVRNKKFGFRVG